jgi:hypothetical protein
MSRNVQQTKRAAAGATESATKGATVQLVKCNRLKSDEKLQVQQTLLYRKYCYHILI